MLRQVAWRSNLNSGLQVVPSHSQFLEREAQMSPTDSHKFWLQMPVDTPWFVTSRFNDPRHYPNNPDKLQRHEGIDLNAVDVQGRPVAVFSGQRGLVDRVANFPPGYGRYVRIRHEWPDGTVYVTWYGHLSEIEVRQGDFVAAGQRIGIAGETGNASGIHLHLTLQHIGHGLPNYVVDDVLDPEPFFHFGPPPAVNECGFLEDVTIPDGTLMQPGQTFEKTWRIRNAGTAAWDGNYHLAFFDEDQMGGPESVPLPDLEPGENGNISIELSAPTGSGRHRSVWKSKNPAGNFFDFELYAEIVVAGTPQDGASFVADVTVPDGTQLSPGQTFLKTWRMRNTGTTNWGSAYRLAFFDDDQMGAPPNIAVPFTRPGEAVEISITLTAPGTPGLALSSWRMRNPQGQLFGDPLFTQIEVVRAEVPTELLDEMRYVDDVTIEDGTKVEPGQRFNKIWRVRNSGTSSWGDGYEFVFVGDDPLDGPESIPLPAVNPGGTVDITLPLKAPETSGIYRSTWKGRNPQGTIFGFEMFTEIEVIRTVTPADELDDAKFVRDVTIPDGTVLQTGETFLKSWRIRNTGTSTWGSGYTLAFFADEQMTSEDHVPLPPAAPGEEVTVSVRLNAPPTPGSHKSTWRPKGPDGEFFGHVFFALITVPSPVPASGRRDKAVFLEHETFRPGTRVVPGQALLKLWRVRNNGDTTWENGYTLAFVEGDQLTEAESVAVPVTEPLKTVRLTLPLEMPTTPGAYRGVWKLRDPEGNLFGPRLVVSVVVREED